MKLKKIGMGMAMVLGLVCAVRAASRPNILFIAVDDLKPLLGCYGDKNVLSPNIDRLASRGMVFLNNACQQAVCGPSRASLMTGTYPDTTRIYDLKTKMREANPNTLTLPEYLRNKGYETTGTGKIYDPRCTDKHYDAPSWSIPHIQYPPNEFYAKGSPKAEGEYHDPEVRKTRREFNAYVKAHGISVGSPEHKRALGEFAKVRPVSECLDHDLPDDAYQAGAIANCAMQQLGTLAEGENPFFLAVGFFKPHLPFVAPKKYWDLYDRSKIKRAPFEQIPKGAPAYAFQDSWELHSGYSGIPAERPWPKTFQLEMIHGYMACVSYVDTQIGKVLDKLDALGLSDNTIIVLWGDHGWHLGDHGMFCKHTNYEQAVRAPLIIACPGQKMKGEKTDSPTEFVDIFPTLCELAGLPEPASCEGLSLVPILRNPDASVRAAALGQYPRENKMGYTLRDKRYRYIKWVRMDYHGGARTGPMANNELYDYEKDPLETVNLASNPEYRDVVEKFELIFHERDVAQP
jgi:iduronate 2-sulfatase